MRSFFQKVSIVCLFLAATTTHAADLQLAISCSELKTLLRDNQQVNLTNGNAISLRQLVAGAPLLKIATTDKSSCLRAYFFWVPSYSYGSNSTPYYPDSGSSSDSGSGYGNYYPSQPYPDYSGGYGGGGDFFGVGGGVTGPNGGQ